METGARDDADGPNAEPNNRRASRKGFLSISVTAYLELLDHLKKLPVAAKPIWF